MSKCIGVNNETCGVEFYDPQFPDDNVCDGCACALGVTPLETCVDINGEYCPICEDKERLLDIIMKEEVKYEDS